MGFIRTNTKNSPKVEDVRTRAKASNVRYHLGKGHVCQCNSSTTRKISSYACSDILHLSICDRDNASKTPEGERKNAEKPDLRDQEGKNAPIKFIISVPVTTRTTRDENIGTVPYSRLDVTENHGSLHGAATPEKRAKHRAVRFVPIGEHGCDRDRKWRRGRQVRPHRFAYLIRLSPLCPTRIIEVSQLGLRPAVGCTRA